MGDSSKDDSKKRFEAKTWLKMGESQLQRGNLKQAALSFQKVLDIFPDHDQAIKYLESIGVERQVIVQRTKQTQKKKQEREIRAKERYRKRERERATREREEYKRRVEHDFSLAPPMPRKRRATDFKLNVEIRDTSTSHGEEPKIVGNDGEFMIECPACSKHSIQLVKDVKSKSRKGRLKGKINCGHCSATISVALKRCIHCESGWSHYNEAPVYRKPHPFVRGASFEYRTGTFCPVCNPQLREDVERYGKPDLSGFRPPDF
ncbi:MAG: tetratricopeptide repeat protein [Candidatus Thorarchaeota archaeon]|jgi:hypothetical protein